jgi:hypothetical protein
MKTLLHIPNSAVHEASPPYTKGRQSISPIPLCFAGLAGPAVGGTPCPASVISAALEKQQNNTNIISLIISNTSPLQRPSTR